MLALVSGLLISGCGQSYQGAAAARTAYAQRAEGSIRIAVVDNPSLAGYLSGIRLALAEVLSAHQGGLLGRKLELRVIQGDSDYAKLLPSLRRIADDPRISAVLGHRTSAVAVPASVIYDAAQMLFMPPFATREQLTLHGFEYVLRMLPNNSVMARQSASLAQLFGYQRMVVLHERNDYAREVAFLFEDAARDLDIKILFRGSFFGAEPNHRGLLGQLVGLDFDALYLSAETDSGARILAQLRELGLDVPVIGSDRLNFGPLAERVGTAGERIMVPAVYNIDNPQPRNAQFIAAYAQAFGGAPNQNAAQGYDSLHLLADIITRAGTTEPQVLATAAHYGPPWIGLTGIYAFDPNGDLYGKRYGFQVLRFGRWWPMPGVTLPYVMASFRALQQHSERAAAETTPPAETAETATPDAESALAESPERAAPAAPASDPYDLSALSQRRLSRARRNQIWLALARELLDFRRLGTVVPDTDAGAALASLARSVGADRGFTVQVCTLPPGERQDRAAHEQAALACWSQLARAMDALLIPADLPLAPALVRRLNRTLRDYGVASFTLTDALEADLGLTLALVASGIDLDDPAVALRFNGLLKGQRIGELNRRLSNLPTISADLAALQALNRLPSAEELVVISASIGAPTANAPQETPAP